MTHSRSTPGAALLLTIVLTAVLASSTFAQAPDPCTLLTPAEIEAATGMKVGPLAIDERMGTAGGRLCQGKLGDIGGAGVLARQLRPGETPARILSETSARKIRTAEAPGVGPGAFYMYPGMGMVQLNAFKGSIHVIVQLMAIGAPEPKLQAAAETLMKTVLGRVK
jgi:hypothetical protein